MEIADGDTQGAAGVAIEVHSKTDPDAPIALAFEHFEGEEKIVNGIDQYPVKTGDEEIGAESDAGHAIPIEAEMFGWGGDDNALDTALIENAVDPGEGDTGLGDPQLFNAIAELQSAFPRAFDDGLVEFVFAPGIFFQVPVQPDNGEEIF